MNLENYHDKRTGFSFYYNLKVLSLKYCLDKNYDYIVYTDADWRSRDEFSEQKFLDFLPIAKKLWNENKTGGHFVPFFMFRKEYNSLGSNDLDNFKFQAREDSDFAFRLVLAGYKTIQIPTFVYHFGSRGNRRAKDNSGTWKDSSEWQQIELRSIRNFIRKWKTIRMHEEDLTPLKPKVYNIGFKLNNATYEAIEWFEPWCDQLYTDLIGDDTRIIDLYIEREQPNTKFNLREKIDPPSLNTNIIVEFDTQRLDQNDVNNLQHLSEIISQSGEIGEFELGNLRITIKSLQTYEHELIVCKNEPISLKNE